MTRGGFRWCVPTATVATLLLAFNVASGQELKLPEAVDQPPPWLVKDAPFDVAAFFKLPPADQNAAPLYLDALTEFAPDVIGACFPPGPERDNRLQDAQNRLKPFLPVYQAFQKDPRGVSAEALESAIAPYQVGFQKLAEAQSLPRCVFATGIGVTALLPHVQAARQVVRVAVLRVRRALDQNDIDAALGDVARVLRISRDLRPRGFFITQLVADAMDTMTHKGLVLPILASPALRPEHCDRLVALLAEHQAQSINSYTEGLKADWITQRVLIHDLMHDREGLAKRLNVPPGASIVATMTTVTSVAPPGAAQPRQPIGPVFTKLLLQAAEPRLAKMSDADIAPALAKLGEHTRAALRLDGVPYAERLRTLPDPNKTLAGDDPILVIRRAIEPATGVFTTAEARHETSLHALTCLIALRRRQLTHPGLPADLAEAVKAAGLKAVPLDPYDGKPLRTAKIGGETVVYSVSRDGRDDGGLIDSKNDTQPGDSVFSLLPVAAAR